jgi:1-phosphatidylinositol-4-phosphate 5-kinase
VVYGDRFKAFIRGITMSKEEAERVALGQEVPSLRIDVVPPTETGMEGQKATDEGVASSSQAQQRKSAEKVITKAERQAEKSEKRSGNEEKTPERTLASVRSPSAERTNGIAGQTLPVVEEAGENSSTGGRSGDEASSSDQNPTINVNAYPGRGRSDNEEHQRGFSS